MSSSQKGSKEELEVLHKILGVAVTISFFPDQATYRSVYAGEVSGITDCYGGASLDHPECQGHLHFRVILVPMIRV